VPAVQFLLLVAARDAQKSPFSQILLERRNRVTSPSEFKSIIRTGCKVVCPHFLCYGSDSNEAKFGIIVSKKSGNAVVRNRIRRRTRAAARQLIDSRQVNKEPIKGLFVIRFRADANEPSFAEILDELEQAMIQYQKSNN
jgi:ribonuclease P protein component